MATYTVYEGVIDDLDVDPNAAAKDFTATCTDGWAAPGDTTLSTPVYQGKRTGDLINIVLDAVGWPAAKRSIDAGATLVPYWWLEGVDAATAVDDLVHSEGPPAIAYVAAGTFVFRDRHHRLTLAASTTSQGMYTHTIPAGALAGDHKIVAGSFGYDHGLRNVINAANLEVTPRIPQDRQVVWNSDDPIALGASESATLVIRTDDPFIDLQVPQALVTYLSDGTFTHDYHVAQGSATFTLSRTSGQSAFLTITAGLSGVFLDLGIKVRGTPLTAGATRKYSAADASSQSTFGVKNWDRSAPWAYFYDADALVQRIVSGYARPLPSVTFDIEGVLSPATLAQILRQQISDRISVRNDEMGLSGDFMVEQLKHTIRQLGVRHTLTVGAQQAAPSQASNPFTFDVNGKGFDQGQFTLATGASPASMFRFDTASPTTQGFGAGVFAA